LEKRYNAIAKRLGAINSDYFVRFEFQPNGVRIDGAVYPVVKMAWAEGETLGEFLEREKANAGVCRNLRDALRDLEIFLRANDIAHGDIQPGNLMVSDRGRKVRLIDYDGMFVEELRADRGAELGHRNFQHPGRTEGAFDQTLDRFSFILLELALDSLSLSPALWDSTRSDGDAFLFRANDFIAPERANVFTALSKFNQLSGHVRDFAAVCTGRFSDVPSLQDFINARNIPTVRVRLSSPEHQAYIAPHSVLDASNYEECLDHVGDRIELIGKVTEVAPGTTRNKKPYVFVNFGDWRGTTVKIAIWSEGLTKLRVVPDASWVGRWISVVGLLEPPYINWKYGYSHLSISLTDPGQMTTLSQDEAAFRLGSQTGPPTRSSNAERLREPIGRPGVSRTGTPGAPKPTRSKNQHILDQMGAPSRPSIQSTGSSLRQAPSSGQPGYQRASPPPSQPSPGSTGCLILLLMSVGILTVMLIGSSARAFDRSISSAHHAHHVGGRPL
jgi:serine/threonine protein kinase